MEHLSKCSNDRWNKAQDWELKFWLKTTRNGDDWNLWWLNKFDNYKSITGKKFDSLLEVGCGPYAKNTEYFINNFPEIKRVSLLDPLLDTFLQNNFYVKQLKERTNASVSSVALEDYNPQEKFDVVICINVLDHVKNTDLCMENIYNSLNEKGILILGQDLTSEEDLRRCPATVNDVGHPIKLDQSYLYKVLSNKTKDIYNKILPKEQGRNPSAHYGTLLYIGEKI